MIETHVVPPNTLLARYLRDGTYTDCYRTVVGQSVTLADYVYAFYTTRVFELERAILKVAVAKPSTDAQARALADGRADTFAAWRVEARASDELLMCDFMDRTRSWLKVEPLGGGATALWFGSAVVPITDKKGLTRLGSTYSALLGFHKVYSRVLLGAARARVVKLA